MTNRLRSLGCVGYYPLVNPAEPEYNSTPQSLQLPKSQSQSTMVRKALTLSAHPNEWRCCVLVQQRGRCR